MSKIVITFDQALVSPELLAEIHYFIKGCLTVDRDSPAPENSFYTTTLEN